jgi:heat-inducible transcriptional repressor
VSTQHKAGAKRDRRDLPDGSNFADRRTAVLYAVVTEYIRTGLPAGSRTLAETYGLDLSPATVRAVLKELEDENLLTQPHTSAGRLPTDRALRLYVDALLSTQDPMHVPRDRAERIRRFLSEREGVATGTSARIRPRELGELLSELSGNPAIVLQSRDETSVVRKIRFIPTRPGELLAVVVIEDGSVENRFIQLDSALDAGELERVHNLLDELCKSCTLVELRQRLGNLSLIDHDGTRALGQMGEGLVRSTLNEVGSAQELVVTGRTSLDVAHPERTRQMLIVLEDRQRLIRLLDRVLGSDRVQVFLGKETESGPGESLSLVATGFEQVQGVRGAMGVLGPPGMDYPGLIPLLASMARAMREGWKAPLPHEPEEP